MARECRVVRIARFEYRRWPSRTPFFGGIHAAIASSLSQIVTSLRLLRPRSYSLQFRIWYFVLYWRWTRLDFPAPMTLQCSIARRVFKGFGVTKWLRTDIHRRSGQGVVIRRRVAADRRPSNRPPKRSAGVCRGGTCRNPSYRERPLHGRQGEKRRDGSRVFA